MKEEVDELVFLKAGDLHWKIVSVYMNKAGQVVLKMKSKHVGGTFTKKKKRTHTHIYALSLASKANTIQYKK